MSNFAMPKQVTDLPPDQQEAIRQVLIKSNLLTSSGDLADLTFETMSQKHKEALKATLGIVGLEDNIEAFSFNPKCIAARIAEGAAVAACASVPGGQIAIGACIAAAHEAANLACK